MPFTFVNETQSRLPSAILVFHHYFFCKHLFYKISIILILERAATNPTRLNEAPTKRYSTKQIESKKRLQQYTNAFVQAPCDMLRGKIATFSLARYKREVPRTGTGKSQISLSYRYERSSSYRHDEKSFLSRRYEGKSQLSFSPGTREKFLVPAR
jgi:uncharacterized membrane protein